MQSRRHINCELGSTLEQTVAIKRFQQKAENATCRVRLQTECIPQPAVQTKDTHDYQFVNVSKH